MRRRVFFKYIIKELLIYFLVCFLFFFLIFFINQILLTAEDLLKKRVPLKDVTLLIVYSLPFIIAQSAPFATLVGFLMCLGRMAGSNEILIFRASGNSYQKLLVPVVLLGLLISLFSFFVNDYLLPLGTIKYKDLLSSISASNPAVVLEPHSIKRTKDSTLVIGDVSDNVVSDLLLFDVDKEGNQRIIVAGKSTIIAPEDPSVIMQLDMESPQVVFLKFDDHDSFDYLTAKRADMNIFESTFSSYEGGVDPSEMTTVDLYKKLSIMKKQEEKNSYFLNSVELEFNKKFSLPFGSLFFAFLALPLAISFGKHHGQTIGLILGIGISVMYWAVFMLGQTSAYRSGFNGFWAVWLPNMIVLFAGFFAYIGLVKK